MQKNITEELSKDIVEKVDKIKNDSNDDMKLWISQEVSRQININSKKEKTDGF